MQADQQTWSDPCQVHRALDQIVQIRPQPFIEDHLADEIAKRVIMQHLASHRIRERLDEIGGRRCGHQSADRAFRQTTLPHILQGALQRILHRRHVPARVVKRIDELERIRPQHAHGNSVEAAFDDRSQFARCGVAQDRLVAAQQVLPRAGLARGLPCGVQVGAKPLLQAVAIKTGELRRTLASRARSAAARGPGRR